MTDLKPSHLVPTEDCLRRSSSVTAQPRISVPPPRPPRFQGGGSRAAGQPRPLRAPAVRAPSGAQQVALSLCTRPFPDVIRPWLPRAPQIRSRWPQGSCRLQQKPPEPAGPQDPQPMGPKPGSGRHALAWGPTHLSAGLARKRVPPFSLNFCLGLFCFAWHALVSF